jgi:hypothetical protein
VAVCDPPGVEATPIPQAAPGPPQQPRGDRERYRRRQRRRGIVAWSAFALVAVFVALVAIGAAVGDNHSDSTVDAASLTGLFPAEMSSTQYEHIHKGESESEVLQEVAVPGEVETEVADSELLQLFPPPPSGTSCRFWALSDAPGHLVRLCFAESGRALAQKSVAAQGEDEAPHYLA